MLNTRILPVRLVRRTMTVNGHRVASVTPCVLHGRPSLTIRFDDGASPITLAPDAEVSGVATRNEVLAGPTGRSSWSGKHSRNAVVYGDGLAVQRGRGGRS